MPESATEFALPLVVRIERDDPPVRTDALEAAAVAVLTMLTDGCEFWRERIEEWDSQRIRKVVRRARGADWRRAASLPGLDVVRATAEVRVFPPVPIDDWPPELARLQVGGTVLEPDAPPPQTPGAPVILLNPDAGMTTGKAMAQAGHAAQLGWRALTAGSRERWRADGFPLAVRDATADAWDAALDGGAVVVHDGGFTEVAPGTATAAIRFPSRDG